jgi:hypothetical protein
MSTELATRYVDDDDASPRTGGEDLRQGIAVTFNGKDGCWYRNSTTKLPIGSQFLLLGFAGSNLKWKEVNGKRQVERRNLSDDELASSPAAERVRRSLGDHDESSWPLGLNGEPADPWQLNLYVYLHSLETGETLTYSTRSWSGRKDV